MSNTSAITAPYLTQINDSAGVQEITAASYTVQSFDLGKVLVFNSASAQTLTIPAGLPKYFTITLLRIGAGAVTLTAGSGATINVNGTSALPRYTPVELISYSASVYSAGGADTTSASTISQTIATAAGNTDLPIIAPVTGNVAAVYFSGTDTLATSDTDYVTWTVTNRGQAGVSSTSVLGSTTTNSTRATGGSAITAETLRTLTLTSTAADLAVTVGDRLRVRYAVTGTLANTVTGAVTTIIFTR